MATYIKTLKHGEDEIAPRTKAKAVTMEDGTLLEAALNGKAATVDLTAHIENTETHVTALERINWNAKQDALTFDTAPTAGSQNPVTSGGIKAALDAHNQAASTITAGTFAGEVAANAAGQTAGNSILRNSKLVSAETAPDVNGEIYWTYQ